MPRYSDEWVVTKSVFEYTTGGSCACCSFPAIFDPNGLKGLINSISDLETDVANEELNAIDQSPWPPEMRDSIWSDRVKVRHKMKREIKMYRDFLEEVGKDNLLRFCMEDLKPQTLKKMFQMARSQVTDILTNRYKVCAAYGTLLCSVVEQVANFQMTKYSTDGRGAEEMEFEKHLTFNRFGGFILDVTTSGSEDDLLQVNEEILNVFLNMFTSLGDTILLHRGPSTMAAVGSKNDDDNDDDGEEGDADETSKVVSIEKGPSFRSDRRIVRLLIARYWADELISKYRGFKGNSDGVLQY